MNTAQPAGVGRQQSHNSKGHLQPPSMPDLRDLIFAGLGQTRFAARLTANAGGVLAGVSAAAQAAAAVDLQADWTRQAGDRLEPGAVVAVVSGPAKAIALGEERLLGCLGKASGIATAARRAVELAAGRIRVVSGAWKKMPPELKMMVRQAAAAGGLPTRIVDEPFIYLDKNYIRMLGGITSTLAAVREMAGIKVIQIRGEEAGVARETAWACRDGTGVVMVDTGRCQDAVVALEVAAAYPAVQVAFAGSISLEDIPALADLGLDILDVGAAIMDAPLLDMKLDVVSADDGCIPNFRKHPE
jgi:nicotinate-nucleotide pyrophosphorylase (carboxylating)